MPYSGDTGYYQAEGKEGVLPEHLREQEKGKREKRGEWRRGENGEEEKNSNS
jgi:hypothetical protein